MTRHFLRSATFPLASLVVAFLIGCESPAPSALVISAQRGQSQAQQDRDKGDCQNMASAQANSSASWAQIFSACMSSRGYLVQ